MIVSVHQAVIHPICCLGLYFSALYIIKLAFIDFDPKLIDLNLYLESTSLYLFEE